MPKVGFKFSEESKRKMSESRKKFFKRVPNAMVGNNNHQWIDGRKTYSKLRFRPDGSLVPCQKCGSYKNTHAHHIDHDRTNNVDSNIIIFCMQCHFRHHRLAKKLDILLAEKSL